MRITLRKTTLGLAASIIMVCSSGAFALHTFAAENQTTFIAQYEQSQAKEAKLLQVAESGSSATGGSVSEFGTLVNNLNQQILSLYASEQALASAESTTSSLPNQSLSPANLEAEKKNVAYEIRQEQALIKQYRRAKNTVLLKSAQLRRTALLSQLRSINQELNQVKALKGDWKGHPFGGSLNDLQQSIRRLQAAVIYYTSLWIQAKNS